MPQWPDSAAGRLLRILERHYGSLVPPECDGPFEMILREIVAYLTDDVRRDAAFAALREQVGLTPAKILAARPAVLEAIARMGSPIAAEVRAARLQVAAQLVRDEFGGDLKSVLRLPAPKAKKGLMRFPMIGEPGAEKILLFSGVLNVLALESNGLRVLVRVGIAEEGRSYADTYKRIRQATLDQLPVDTRLLLISHLLLRRHGQKLCLRADPACAACPANGECRYYQNTKRPG